MEGHRGEPTLKPPFPSVEGYLKKPTNVNNVETYVWDYNVPGQVSGCEIYPDYCDHDTSPGFNDWTDPD